MIALIPNTFRGTAVLWFDGHGKKHLFDANGQPTAGVMKLLESGRAVISADLFLTGEYLLDENSEAPAPKVNESFPGYTFGYNRPLISERVHDILSVIGGMRWFSPVKTIQLVGTGDAGLWVLLARAVSEHAIDRCIVDLQGFGFSAINSVNDPRMLPGGLKYGGIGGLAGLIAPDQLTVFGTRDLPEKELSPLKHVYRASSGKLALFNQPLNDESAVDTILNN